MAQYKARKEPAAEWFDNNAVDSLARTVYEDEPTDTGLVTTEGVPIYRYPDQIGFIRRS